MREEITTKTEQLSRIANVEGLRILAGFGIVWFHTENAAARSIGYAGLPVFLMVFCALTVSRQRHDEESVSIFAKRKALRLIKPWVFWSIVYLVAKVAKQIYLREALAGFLEGNMLFVGTHIHLWYLPYAFMASLVIFPLRRLGVQSQHHRTLLLAVGISFILLVLCPVVMVFFELPLPVPQWLFGLPAVLLGVAIGMAHSRLNCSKQRLFYLMLVLSTVFICLLMKHLGYRRLATPYSIAVVLVCGAFVWNGRLRKSLHKWASLTYGIYLIHPLVGMMLRHGGMDRVSPWVMMLVVFLLSSVITLILQKTPLNQFI